MATFDKGTSYDIFKHNIDNNVQRSLFNMSYLHSFDCDFGELKPFYLQETVPNDTFTLSNDILIRVSPMVVPLMSRIRVYTHYYYSRCRDLFANWDNYITRGRSGNYEVELPKIETNSAQNIQIKDSDNETFHGLYCHDGILNALGLPQLQKYGESGVEQPSKTTNVKTNKEYSIKHQILPAFMYQRIYRDYYINKNLNQDDTHWFPEIEQDFILNKNGKDTDSGNQYFLPTLTEDEVSQRIKTDSQTNQTTISSDYSIFAKRWRNWRDDYFTSCMPWPQRGTAPTLEMENEPQKHKITMVDQNGNPAVLPRVMNDSITEEVKSIGAANAGTGGTTSPYNYILIKGEAQPLAAPKTYAETNGYTLVTEKIAVQMQLTMEKLRQLSIMQLWQERNSRTDGDYNSMIQTHFGRNPHIEDKTPIYIGGTVQDIVVSEILQTSETSGTDGTPLGTGAGHAMSSGAGYVGEFNCPDYGYIMGIISIVPDTTYTEGIDKEWTRETFADWYYPEFNGLGAQGILNKELWVNENEEKNNELWGYQERFSEMKHRRNIVTGQLANKNDSYFKSWTMARFFSGQPTLSNSFVNTKGTIRHDVFALPEETPFTIQVANIARAVRPMPYLSIPKGII